MIYTPVLLVKLFPSGKFFPVKVDHTKKMSECLPRRCNEFFCLAGF